MQKDFWLQSKAAGSGRLHSGPKHLADRRQKQAGIYKIITDGTRANTLVFTDDGEFLGFSEFEFKAVMFKKEVWTLRGAVPREGFSPQVLNHPPIELTYCYNRRIPSICQGFELKLFGEVIENVCDLDFIVNDSAIVCKARKVLGYKIDEDTNREIPNAYSEIDLIAKLE